MSERPALVQSKEVWARRFLFHDDRDIFQPPAKSPWDLLQRPFHECVKFARPHIYQCRTAVELRACV